MEKQKKKVSNLNLISERKRFSLIYGKEIIIWRVSMYLIPLKYEFRLCNDLMP